ncbi:hypothetical protein [Pseudoduganella umbonata]|uniref:Uncharacterized protein n=1 Tax=Pseudoduganella umbonata TaxID=864828 RepID=A0A4P8HL12_9BURK|nr:hypothetical protein [Pseudoduganella umbonata]MBB3221297.1 hypothetical protein [Pseudoduganella umbonata]QCP10469.1 hypothetical protein FCL38_08535 [Pseudoduganella umbonata]
MNEIVQLMLEAHGGQPRWNGFSTLQAHLTQGGILWPLKGKGGMLDEVDVTIDLHRQWTSHAPFGAAGRRTSVTPQRAAIEAADGSVIEELLAPRASFGGFGLETPWSDLQLAYFVGYAMWNYLTLPFAFVQPGFEFEQLDDWRENGETWHRLRVLYPAAVATHNATQTFYVSPAGQLRRHDYDVDINGGTPAVHYFHDYTTVQGIALPTRHLIYVRDADLGHQPEPLVVSIVVSKARFS